MLLLLSTTVIANFKKRYVLEFDLKKSPIGDFFLFEAYKPTIIKIGVKERIVF